MRYESKKRENTESRMNLVEDHPDETSVPSADQAGDQRSQSDRRQRPTSPWDSFPPAGQRMSNRRRAEHCRPYFVDRFPTAMFVFILLLLIASLTDAVLTLMLLHVGGQEVNPVMDYLLAHGLMAFLLGKYLLTVLGLPFLMIFSKHYLFGTRVRVGYLIPCTVVLYAVLIGYQLILVENHGAW
jgi:hypothetical protein